MKVAYSELWLFNQTVELVNKHKIKKIIETGTFLGESTAILARIGPSVISIESNVDFYNQAKENLKNVNNAMVIHGKSEDVLLSVISDHEEGLLFFLDAHCNVPYPIKKELTVFSEKKVEPVIMIHDFYVPDLSGGAKFGYDLADNNQPLDFEWIKPELIRIYGDHFNYKYNEEIQEVNSGIIIIEPAEKL